MEAPTSPLIDMSVSLHTPSPPPSPASLHQPLALILDLNGTLLYRSTTPVKDARVLGRLMRGKHVYARPGMVKALVALSDRYALYVCTSMNEDNAHSALSYVFPSYRHYVKGVLAGGRYNTPAPDRTKEWETVRNVESVWAATTPYDATTALFVDNELKKCIHAPESCLVVPEMGTVEVKTGTTLVAEQLERYLLGMYLSLVVRSPPPTTPSTPLATPSTPPTTSQAHALDVRRYILDHPAGFHTPTRQPTFHARVGTTRVAVTDPGGQVDVGYDVQTARTVRRGSSSSSGSSRGGGTRGATTGTYDTTDSLRTALRGVGIGVEECTLTIDHVDGTLLHLSDVPHRLRCTVKLPIPTGDRIESRIALSRLLEVRCERTFSLKVAGSVVRVVLGCV
jgi:hypothetical protein